jgi:hypothetical protein
LVSDQVQELSRGQTLNPKLFRAAKISNVMSDYILATCSDGQFQHHIVVGIGQERPPQEVDFLQMGLAGKVPQESRRIRWRPTGRQVLSPSQDLLPLGIEAHGEARLKNRTWNCANQRKTRAQPRTRGGHQHIGVDYNSYCRRLSHAFSYGILSVSPMTPNFAVSLRYEIRSGLISDCRA